MDEQIAAFASLFRVSATALRKLWSAERAGRAAVFFEVAAQLELLADKLEQHLEDKDRRP